MFLKHSWQGACRCSRFLRDHQPAASGSGTGKAKATPSSPGAASSTPSSPGAASSAISTTATASGASDGRAGRAHGTHANADDVPATRPLHDGDDAAPDAYAAPDADAAPHADASPDADAAPDAAPDPAPDAAPDDAYDDATKGTMGKSHAAWLGAEVIHIVTPCVMQHVYTHVLQVSRCRASGTIKVSGGRRDLW